MRKFLTNSGVLLALTITLLVSCKKETDQLLPAPAAATKAIPPSLAEFKTWYAGRAKASSATSRESGSSVASRVEQSDSVAGKGWLAIKWAQLDTISNGAEPLAFLPIQGDQVGFTSQYQGYRRVVMGKRAGGPPNGVIIEVIHKGEILGSRPLNEIFRALYTAQQQGQVAQLKGFTGFTAFYSRENHYITGRAYRNGVSNASPNWLRSLPAESPAVRKPGTVRPNDVDITCVGSIVNTSTSLAAGDDVVIWNCIMGSHGGGGSPPPNNPFGNPGDNPGGNPGSGGGLGGSGGGGSSGPIPNEQYDDGSGNGYGGYPPDGGSGGSSTTTLTTLSSQWGINPLAILKPCPGLTDAWRPLISFIPPAVVTDKLRNLTTAQKEAIGMGLGNIPGTSAAYTWQIQAIQSASGTAINLDYFPIDIPTLPVVNSQRLTAEQFMEYVRLNINSFIDPGQPTFSPCSHILNSDADWQNHALGTIMDIGIPIDIGSVILSKYTPNEWDFSTIHEPFLDNGSHPVSGTRAFSCTPSGAGATFYIRGADRINYSAGELVVYQLNLRIYFG